MADVSFELDAAGLSELCRSGPMQAALREEAEALARAANGDAYAHEGSLHIRGGRFEVDPYGASVDVLDRTAVGVAYTRTAVGALNEARHKSLSRQNH